MDSFWTAFGAVSGGIAALFAGGALIAVWFQLKATKQLQRRQIAEEAYREYLGLTIEHPEFASATDTSNPAYKWFVTYMLAAMESIEAAIRDDREDWPAWKTTIERGLRRHEAYLSDPAKLEPGEMETYAAPFRELFRSVVGSTKGGVV